jgi:transcriptional regulator with XRE-family HTH domain
MVPSSAGVGGHLRAARLARRLTLADVADAAGITKGFLSKLERDQATASVASLMRLCETLEISVGELFEAPQGAVVRRDDYLPINFGGVRMQEFLLTPSGERRLQAIFSRIEPDGGSGPELYSIPAEVEFVYVLSGQLGVRLNDGETVLGPGDAMTFPQAPHAFRSIAESETTEVLWVFTPAMPLDSPIY